MCIEDSTANKKVLFNNPLMQPILNLDIPNVIVILRKIKKVLQVKKTASFKPTAFVIETEESDEEEAKEEQVDLEFNGTQGSNRTRDFSIDTISSNCSMDSTDDGELGPLGKPAFDTMCKPSAI